jgi:hypothetical protein
MGALYPAVAEPREMRPDKELDPINKALDRLSGEQAVWVGARKGLVAMSPHIFGCMDRLSLALAMSSCSGCLSL